MEGRDLGKIRKDGYFRGTKANAFRFQFIGVVMFLALGIGGLRIYYNDRFTLLNRITEYIQQFDDREALDNRAALQAKRLERTRKLNERRDDRF